MPGVPNADSTNGITCESCEEESEEWIDLEITNITADEPVTVERQFCLGCAYILSAKLGVDFEEEEEGYFRINQFGQFETFSKDCN